MSYATERMLKDLDGKLIPQVYNPDTDAFEPLQGTQAAGYRVNVTGSIPAGTNNIGDVDVLSLNGYSGAIAAASGSAIPAGVVQVGGGDVSGFLRGVNVHTFANGDGISASGFRQLMTAAAALDFNNTTLDRRRNNVTATLFSSAARTATASSSDQTNYNGQGVIVTINVTAITDTPSVVFTIEAKDPISGAYTAVLTSAAIVGTGTTRLRVGGAITAAANVAVADWIGRTWRVTATHADADSITYSVSAETMTA